MLEKGTTSLSRTTLDKDLQRDLQIIVLIWETLKFGMMKKVDKSEISTVKSFNEADVSSVGPFAKLEKWALAIRQSFCQWAHVSG